MESLMKTTLLKASVVAATLVLAAGCASNGDLDKVREEAAAAQQTADEAKQSAADANTKIDRAFKKSMYK